MRAVDHRAQLEHLESPAVHSDALLREERRAAGGADDAGGSQQHDRQRDDRERQSEGQVDRAFEDAPTVRNVALDRRSDGDLHGLGDRSGRRMAKAAGCPARPVSVYTTKKVELHFHRIASFFNRTPQVSPYPVK